MDGFKTVIAALIVLNVTGFGQSQVVYEKLTPDEEVKIFPMNNSEIREYEILPIHKSIIQRRYGRNVVPMKIKAFGNDIKLWLNPLTSIIASADTPVFTITKGINVELQPGEMAATIAKLYEDKSKAATLSIDEIPGGRVELNGIVGTDNIYIQPFPTEYEFDIRRRRRSIDNIPESEINNYTYHVLYKIPDVPDASKPLKTPFPNSLRSKRSAPPTIYPEIMVIIDYPLFKLFNSNYYATLSHILAFWNGVDLKYRPFEFPNIRLNIAGVIIATQPNSLEYTQYHEKNGDLLVKEAIIGARLWTTRLENKLKPNYNFDIAITMTSEVLGQTINNTYNRLTSGISLNRGACSYFNNGKDEWTHKVAIIKENVDFAGITVAAHELAHLFGVRHDGFYNDCNSDDGYIMAPTISITKNSVGFSNCSLEQMEEFLHTVPTCLYNKPKRTSKLVARFLPGRLKDANMQCKVLSGTSALFINETICTSLYCQSSTDPQGTQYPAAADGTPCGKAKMCLHGQCVREIYADFWIAGKNHL